MIVTVVSNVHHVSTLCIYMITILFYQLTKSLYWFVSLFLGEIPTPTIYVYVFSVKESVKKSNCFNVCNEHSYKIKQPFKTNGLLEWS